MSDWKDFLMNDPRINLELVLRKTIRDLPPRSKLASYKEIKLIEQSIKELSKIKKKLQKMSPHSSAFRDALEHIEMAKKDLNMELNLRPENKNSLEDKKKRRGPPLYPKKLSEKIFKILEEAKNNKAKLAALVKFFTPRGEFDNWIQEKTDGVLTGPSKKKNDDITADWASDRDWLNEFKHRAKDNISRK